MIKIFLSVRNRLAMTKKCIEALERHSTLPHDIYVYDNCSNYRIREHFEFAYNLYKYGLVVEYVFNTKRSTFNAFSKAVACNQFGQKHMMDPEWKKYEFITILDNDVIVLPEWDESIKKAWQDVKKYGLENQIKIIGQSPGGIKGNNIDKKFAGCDARLGKLGGSAFWCIKPNFFRSVGYLDIRKLVGYNKKHDQEYWNLLDKSSRGKPYILGLKKKLCIHCGKIAGSVCNILTKNRSNKNQLDKIKFENAEEKIENMTFDEFMNVIENDNLLIKDW